MGNGFGALLSVTKDQFTNPDVVPPLNELPKNDPMYGFKTERTERGIFDFHFSLGIVNF